MTRKKVKLVWIASDSARKASLKKRRVGLLKKVSELTILCGIHAFVMVYSPDDNEPAVWPSPPEVQQLLARYQSMPEIERSKKMVNQESYLKERIGKEHEQLKKLHRKNKEVEMLHLMRQINQGKALDEFHISELQGLLWLVEEKRKEIRKRIDYFQQDSLPPVPIPPQGPVPGDDKGRVGSNGVDGKPAADPHTWDQWFLDLLNSENIADSSSIRNKTGLPLDTYCGCSIPENDIELSHGSVRGHTGGSDMELPHWSTVGRAGGNIIGMGAMMQPHGYIGGSGFVANGTGPGLQLHGTGGGSTDGSEMGLPFGFFGGWSSGGSYAGLPYDVTRTNWQCNFSP
ncbi:SRF-TF domain-containing protein [Cephalotus follicularis]|uniref:SRF-TF domain-containing protein n=1 Tax=Cephalotus follicularis TaxID=3775 RepID=A0A1Q3B7Y7_CEPFO|nr:SRF-TF domain-containing protein [Cephalotus follicularis]